MTENLLYVCLNAFVAVLGLLSLLALAIRGLLIIFPEKTKPAADAALPVAIAAAVHAALPGARVTHIEPL